MIRRDRSGRSVNSRLAVLSDMRSSAFVAGAPGVVTARPRRCRSSAGSVQSCPMSDPTTSDPAAFDSGHFRSVLGHFPTGVTIVTGIAGDAPTGFTIGSFTSVSLDPPLVGFLPQVDSTTWAAMAGSGSFCVNVLSELQSDLCWRFAKSDTEDTRFEGVTWHHAPSGSPVIDRAVAWIDCSIEDVYTMGDHFFVLGRVGALEADANHDGLPPQPLVFYRGSIGGFSAEG